jgi:replicative DNA helicase
MTLNRNDNPPPAGPTDSMTLPHSIEAEQEVLSAVFVDPTALDLLAEQIRQEDFFQEKHGLIFDTMTRVYERNGTLDFVTLRQELKDTNRWEKVGGTQTLGALLERSGTSTNVAHYCQIVRQKAILRRMIEAARTIETEGFTDQSDVASYLERAEQSVFSVLEERHSTELRPIRDVVRASIGEIEKAFDAEGSVTGLGTGFRDLDNITHGLQKGDLVILAARPAMGKTSLALNMASNAATLNGANVAIFSLEMPAEQLAMRMLAAQGRVDVSRMRGGYLEDRDWTQLTEAADTLSRASIYMDDTPGLTVSNLRAKCRRLHRREGLDFVMVDYLQLMGSQGNERSREQEISAISRALKHLAKELSIPVLALSQLNRGVESRTDKRPLMSDLRESGAIEQDADIIMFIYRDEVYNQNVEETQRGVAEVIISKHRNGPTGTVNLKFWKTYTRFDNLARYEE